MGGWIGQGCKADKQKDPFVFISVTFGCLAITLLHSKQRALPAEGKAKIKKRLWRQNQVSVFTDTVDSREWRQGSCGKGKDLKKNDGKKKAGGEKKVWKIISVMHSYFHEAVRWKDERKGVNHGYDLEYCKQEIRAAWNSTSVWTAIEASLAEDLHLNLLGCCVKCKHEQDAKIVNCLSQIFRWNCYCAAGNIPQRLWSTLTWQHQAGDTSLALCRFTTAV